MVQQTSKPIITCRLPGARIKVEALREDDIKGISFLFVPSSSSSSMLKMSCVVEFALLTSTELQSIVAKQTWDVLGLK